MPIYIDFISVFAVRFGQQVEAVELRFTGFRTKVLLSRPSRGLSLPQYAISGRNYQLCYNLKCVALKYRRAKREEWLWSPRQGSFYHQFDVGAGTAVWIITSARDELEKRVKSLTGSEGDVEDRSFSSPSKSFISSLAVHLMLAQWATEDWRGYIRWLEQVLEENVSNHPKGKRIQANNRRRGTHYGLVMMFPPLRPYPLCRVRKMRQTRQ